MSGLTADQAWEQITDRLTTELADVTFDIWIRPLEAIAIADDGRLIITGPRRIAEWVRRRYAEPIKQAALDLGVPGVVLRVKPEPEPNPNEVRL